MAYLWGQLIPMDGNTVICCGIEECGNIAEEKTYTEPAKDACCSVAEAYSFDYTTNRASCDAEEACSYSISGPVISTAGGPKWRCRGSCPRRKVCRTGTITGYQQYAWEDSPWSSQKCPSGATYKKRDCQTVCGGTTGCRTICKNICEKVTCSSDTTTNNNSNVCTGTVSCGTSGCKCSNNPYWHP